MNQSVESSPVYGVNCIRSEHNFFQDFADLYQTVLIDKTHPTIMEWPLVGWDRTNAMIIVVFVLFVNIIGPTYMRNREPYDLRWLLVPYNACLVIANFFIFLEYARARWMGSIDNNCNSFDILDHPQLYRLASVTWWFYISKLVELSDTIFFVLRKKERQLSRLHLIHHSIVPLLVWGILRIEPGGTNSYFPIINSFVHIIMYTYYGLSAFGNDEGIHLRFKKYVTLLQLFQFILVLYHMMSRPFYGCKPSILSMYFNIAISGFFFLLFCNFYKNEYLKRREKLAKSASNGIHRNGSAKKVT